jgi:multiple sugar transport system ATP-binding protein
MHVCHLVWSGPMATVEFRKVVKRYGEVEVIHGADLAIGDGEFLVLVGPSGCGKSTLLRMVAGLESVTEGELYIGGKLVNDVHPRDRDVAMVFQSYALYPHMTVADNMAFGLRVRKMSRAEITQRVDEAAALLDLTALMDRLPKQLSGGQRQRVAMGRAIVRRPRVFLFDEPLSNLDAALRARMHVELKKMHARLGATMIYVTHDQVEAMTLADRIAVTHQGWLQQVGTPDELYTRPTNAFVGGFIGAPQMNFLSAAAADGHATADGVKLFLDRDVRRGPVTVGIRPHDLSLAELAEAPIRAEIDVIEPLGWESHLHCRVGEAIVLAQVPAEDANSLRVGDAVGLAADRDRIHLFDPESEEAIRG